MKHIIYSLALICLPTMIMAQTDTLSNVIKRDVEVINYYLPTLSNPYKLQVDPVIDDTMSYKATFKYETLNKVQTVKTTPDSLEAATMSFRPEEMQYNTWVKGGVGNYGNILGRLVYNIGTDEKYHLNVDLGHHAMLGKVKLHETDKKVKAPSTRTWLGADFSTFFERTALDANACFSNFTYQYYGYQTIQNEVDYLTSLGDTVKGAQLTDEEKQRQTTFDINVSYGRRMLDPREKFTWNGALGFGAFGNKTGVKEKDILAHFYLRQPIKTNYLLSFDINMNTALISVPEYEGYAYNFSERKHTDVSIRPNFGIDFDMFQLRAGLNFILEFGGEKDNVYMQPDIYADFNVSDGAVTLYLGMTGGYKANTFRQLAKENPWIASDACNYVWKAENNTYLPSEMQTTQNPIRLTAGLRAKIGHVVAFDISADYASFDDEMFFINKGYFSVDSATSDYTNMFGLISENGKLGKINAELNITPTSKSQILLHGAYYNWKLDYIEEAWYKPNYEAGVDIRFYPTDRLLITAGVNSLGKRYGYNHTTRQKEKLDMLLDINLGGEYRMNSQWTAFINFNNMAAQDYRRWLGYSSHKFNVLAGITYKF